MGGSFSSLARDPGYTNVTSVATLSATVSGSPSVPPATVVLRNLDIEIPDLAEEGARMDAEELRGLLPVAAGLVQSIGNMAGFHGSQLMATNRLSRRGDIL